MKTIDEDVETFIKQPNHPAVVKSRVMVTWKTRLKEEIERIDKLWTSKINRRKTGLKQYDYNDLKFWK